MTKRIETPQSIADLCKKVCDTIWMGLHRTEAPVSHVALLLGTAAAESSFTERKQANGPGLGLWQMEPYTAMSIFENNLRYSFLSIKRKKRWRAFTSAWLGLDCVPFFKPNSRAIREHLMWDDPFACTMARWKYLMVKEPIPETLEDLSAYWWYYYQTPEGANAAQWFMDQWYDCRVYNLISLLGYERMG